MRYTFLLLSLIIGLDLFAQTKTDSLLKVIKDQPTNYNAQIEYAGSIYTSEPDSALTIIRNSFSEKLNTEDLALGYKYIGNIYRFVNKIDSSCYYFRISIKYANQIQDNAKRNAALAITLINYANSLIPINKLKNARDTLLLALKMTNDINDTIKKNKLRGVAELNLSQVHTAMGLYDFALQNLNNALEYFKKSNIVTYNTPIYMGFGSIKSRLGLYKEAIKYKQQSIIESEKNKDLINIVYALQNISQDYLKLNLLDSATHYNKECFVYYKKFLNDDQYLPYFQQQGEIEFVRKNYDQSIKFHLKAIKIAKTDNDELKVAENKFLIGDNYVALKKLNDAKVVFLQAMQYYEINNDAIELKEIYLALAKIEQELNNLNQSIIYRTKYDSIAKEIFKEERIKAIAAQEIMFETEQKNKTISNQIANIKKSRYFNLVLILLLIVLLIGGYFIYAYLNIQTQNTKLKAQQLAIQLDDAWKQNEALEQKIEQTIVTVPEITVKNTAPALDDLLLILNEKVKIPYANIQCIESVKNDIYIYGSDTTNAIHKIRYTLKEVQQLLPIYFKKVQRSYIVNLNYVVKIEKQKSKQIMHLENGMQLSITENLENILT